MPNDRLVRNMNADDSPGARVTRLWRRLSPLPAGTWLFSRVFGGIVPYSDSIRPHIRELRPGHARVTMRDRRSVRNHLRSIHAIALTNLAEMTSGLAMVSALPPDARSIVTALSMEFLKKARGSLEAECTCAVPETIPETIEVVVVAEIRDAVGDVVARSRVTWRLASGGK